MLVSKMIEKRLKNERDYPFIVLKTIINKPSVGSPEIRRLLDKKGSLTIEENETLCEIHAVICDLLNQAPHEIFPERYKEGCYIVA